MKAIQKLIVLALFVGLLPVVSFGALTSRQKNTLLGKFYVSNVKGTVTCISDGRVRELKKGDVVLARGARLETAEGSNFTMVYSNQTAVFVDEKTRFEIEKFDQEFFAPNNNLRVEPSNSSTVVRFYTGRLVINTPRLLSGTSMVYETEHAAVVIRGEKILLEGDEKQTHAAIISGNATVNVRDPDGIFVSIGKRIQTGQEAFVKKTVSGQTQDTVTTTEPSKAPKNAAATNAIAANKSAPSAPVSKATEATIVRSSGAAHYQLPGSNVEQPVNEGAKLPVGTTVATEDGAEVLLQPYPGTVATIRPRSKVVIEKLSITTVGKIVKRQTAILELKAGTIISTIDPAKKDINDYGVRTPKGIASAQGTSFSVSVESDDGFSVAATADTVSFVTTGGIRYSISEGNVSITPSGGEPQPPITLAQAVASNPAFVASLQNALSAVTSVVQNNVGNLSAESATNLVTKVAHTVAAALPTQAAEITTQVMNAVTAPSSATAGSIAVSSAAIITGIVSAVPAQAAQIAATAATAAPSQAVTVAAAAAKASPDQASQIATSVTRTFVQVNAQGTVTEASVQNATALAAAVTTSVPAQAAPVAAAVMQALAQAAPQASPQIITQTASTIATAVTTAAPSQAVPVAATMMQAITQTAAFTDVAPQVLGQTAATLAASVTTVVPPQAQEVATAVMQLVMTVLPASATQAVSDSAGLIAAAVTQAAPEQAAAVNQGVASASNQTPEAVASSASQAGAQAAQIAQSVSTISQAATTASQQSAGASTAANAGAQIAAGTGSGTGSGSSGANSTTANNGGSGGNTGGSGGQSGSGGSSGTGSNSGTTTAANDGGTGSGTGGTGSGSGSDSGSGSGSGTGSGGSGSGTGESSSTTTAANDGGTGSAGGGDGTGGSGAGGAGGGDGTGTPGETSIIISQFNPGDIGDVASGLDAAQGAQGGVQFDTSTDTNGTPTVTPVPTIPAAPPVEPVSASRQQ